MKTSPNTDRIAEFRRKLRDLVLEYNVELEVNTGYYEDVKGVDFCVDGKRAVETSTWGGWDFDDNGRKSLEELRRDLANPTVSSTGANTKN